MNPGFTLVRGVEQAGEPALAGAHVLVTYCDGTTEWFVCRADANFRFVSESNPLNSVSVLELGEPIDGKPVKTVKVEEHIEGCLS